MLRIFCFLTAGAFLATHPLPLDVQHANGKTALCAQYRCFASMLGKTACSGTPRLKAGGLRSAWRARKRRQNIELWNLTREQQLT